MRNIRSYGLYKKEDKQLSDKIVNKLSLLAIKYKGNLEYLNKKLYEYTYKYTKYENFINNYFIKEKYKYRKQWPNPPPLRLFFFGKFEGGGINEKKI